MNAAVVTGGAGFVGLNLVEALLHKGYYVYMAVRPNSEHNNRIPNSDKITIVEADLDSIETLLHIKYATKPEYFFHLAWPGEHNDFEIQCKNIEYTLRCVRVAKEIGCMRFICTGSQAEYGVHDGLITENIELTPKTAYGAAKVATSYMSKNLCEQLDIEWVWGRIFSVYGKYEPPTTLMGYLKTCFTSNTVPILTKCTQNWDYIYSSDVADAIVAIAENGKNGEIYNLANGKYMQLKNYVQLVAEYHGYSGKIDFIRSVDNVVTLAPSVDKIQKDTGWKPKVSFIDGLKA